MKRETQFTVISLAIILPVFLLAVSPILFSKKSNKPTNLGRNESSTGQSTVDSSIVNDTSGRNTLAPIQLSAPELPISPTTQPRIWTNADRDACVKSIESHRFQISLFEDEVARDERRLGQPLKILESDSPIERHTKEHANRLGEAVTFSIKEGRRIIAKEKAALSLELDKLQKIDAFLASPKTHDQGTHP